MEKLTKAEEPVMQLLWKLKQAFVKDIIAAMPEPRPPYNTVSSIVRILEEKEMVGHETFGKTHRYYPAVSKNEYRKRLFQSVVQDYFDGSYKALVSHLVEDQSLTKEEVDELRSIIDNPDQL